MRTRAINCCGGLISRVFRGDKSRLVMGSYVSQPGDERMVTGDLTSRFSDRISARTGLSRAGLSRGCCTDDLSLAKRMCVCCDTDARR